MNKTRSELSEPKDVELIIDGFGFMFPPKSNSIRSSLSRESHATVQGDAIKNETDMIKRFTWVTKNKMQVQVITYGATITSVKVPDRNGQLEDVVTGFDNMEGYQMKNNPYFGATVGRVANRTANASFNIGDKIYSLASNVGVNHLHGGIKGFDKANWDYFVDGTKVILSYVSVDGEEGYPGTLLTQVTYDVTVDNIIKINFKCSTTKSTPVNLTNHSYFNLAGHQTGPDEVYQHIITINADKYTPLNEELVTTGEIRPVGGTLYDLRVPRLLSDVMLKTPPFGYDINFCLTKGSNQDLTFAARVLHPKSGRVLEVYSDQPGMQFYTGNSLPDTSEMQDGVPSNVSPIYGKDGAAYIHHGAFCFETQNYPNAVNILKFPKSILNPGEEYIHNVEYKFGLQLGEYC